MWSPGETLIIDWDQEGPLHVFCAVLAYNRVRTAPESKGMLEHLVGYAKADLVVPAEESVSDLVGANAGRCSGAPR